MKLFLVAALAVCVLGAEPAVAQTMSPSAAPSATPSPAPSPTPRPWQAAAFEDTSYSSASSAKSFQFINGGNARVFDNLNNDVDLNNLNLSLTKTGTFGGKVETTIGTDAGVVESFPANSAKNDIDLTQAYLSYSAGPFTLIGGKFETLAGAEVIESPSDVNFSRSILFGYAVPFTHTGARLSYSANSALTLNAGINNGWDSLNSSGTHSRTAEFGVNVVPNKYVSLTLDGYSGTAAVVTPPAPVVSGQRSLVDAVLTVHPTSALTLTGNYDTGRQANALLVNGLGMPTVPASGTATWNGAAGYATYALNSLFSATVRGEYFNDNGGFRTGFDQQWKEATFTFQYSAGSNAIVRLEYRLDHSNQATFSDGLDAFGNPIGINHLGSLGIEAIIHT